MSNILIGDNLKNYITTSGPEKFKVIVNKAPSLLNSLIAGLPVDFQKAAPMIEDKIAPLLGNLNAASKKHFVGHIAKRVKSTAKIVTELIAGAATKKDAADSDEPVEEEFSPEVLGKARSLSFDPQLFRRRIDSVGALGVVGERKNIAVLMCSLDSRLLLDRGMPGQNVIAVKIAGHQGSGKSYTLMMTLRLYPDSAYLMITSGSDRCLYYMERGIKHMCLVVAEAFQLSGNRGDNEVTYMIRTLLSEGRLSRLTTVKDESGNNVSVEKSLEGPVSFITTTIEHGLEAQLEDRIFTVHPDESIDQTKRIVENRARQISGTGPKQDDEEIQVWKAFHQSLEPVSVVIPFAVDIANYLNRSKVLPINARRAFNKVINIIQAVTCAYQFQREQDEAGNLIATMSDYFMALQIVSESFKENLGQLPKATDLRLEYIASVGQVSPKNLATHFGVSRSAISQWIKKLEAEGILKWVDDKGVDYPDDKALNAAKKSGKAHIQVVAQTSDPWSSLGLPSPLELTLESTWRTDGADYQLYDLKLDAVTTPDLLPAPAFSVTDALRDVDSESFEDSEQAEDIVLDLF